MVMDQVDPADVDDAIEALANRLGLDEAKVVRQFRVWMHGPPKATGLETSLEADTILPLLGKIQGELGPVAKSGEDTFLHRTYATIGDVMAVVGPVLFNHEATLIQEPEFLGTVRVGRPFKKGTGHEILEVDLARYAMRTRLWKAGQWVGNTFVADCESTEPKAVGSLDTYLRRYGIVTLFLLVTADDDGEAAGREPAKPKQRPRARTGARTEPAAAAAVRAGTGKFSDHQVEDGLKRAQDALWDRLVKAADGDENVAKDILVDVSRDAQGLGVRSVYQLRDDQAIDRASQALEGSKWSG
ncbi:MAG: ERF family protein [Dehalococcoidia bacterium]